MFLERLRPFYLGEGGGGVDTVRWSEGCVHRHGRPLTAQIHPPRRSIPLPAPLSGTFSIIFYYFLQISFSIYESTGSNLNSHTRVFDLKIFNRSNVIFLNFYRLCKHRFLRMGCYTNFDRYSRVIGQFNWFNPINLKLVVKRRWTNTYGLKHRSMSPFFY